MCYILRSSCSYSTEQYYSVFCTPFPPPPPHLRLQAEIFSSKLIIDLAAKGTLSVDLMVRKHYIDEMILYCNNPSLSKSGTLSRRN
jgi:hypothetical protein